jgi:chorismate synthase
MSLLFELFFSSEAMNLLELAAVLAALLLSTAVKTLELAAGFRRETKAGDEAEDEVETFCRKREPIES